MAEKAAPRLAEPIPVPGLHAEGASIEVRDEFLRMVFWIDLETVEFSPPERRIVARIGMPMSAALALAADLRTKVRGDGGH